MQLDRETVGGNFIRSFSPGELRINDAVYAGHVIITPDAVVENWSPAEITSLSIADFDAALSASPELIVFGTGVRQVFPPATVTTEILRRGIGFEVMDTTAACRTFNVLIGDGRRIVAALLIR